MKLLCETVGETSHIANSIQRLLSDFQLSSLPSGKALVVRFTSDEASLVLAIAQANDQADRSLCCSVGRVLHHVRCQFWKVFRRSIGVPAHILASCAGNVSYPFTKTTLGFLSIILGLVFTSIDSVVDALMHGRLPEKWNSLARLRLGSSSCWIHICGGVLIFPADTTQIIHLIGQRLSLSWLSPRVA